MNKENKNHFQYIYFSIILIIGILIGVFISQNHEKQIKNTNADNSKHINKINNVINYIHNNYVDSIDYDKLVEEAISDILISLDPHSSYISSKEIEKVNEQITGNFEGIGIQFRMEKDTIFVIQTIANGPSERVGIKAGDRIVEIDGENVAGVCFSSDDAVKKLKGKKGTKVNVKVKRLGFDQTINFSIVRDVIPTFSIDYSGMINKDIGYIKLSSFNFNSDKEFYEALVKLNNSGMSKLILDLRNNGGGLLDVCLKITDNFFDKNVLLVYTQGLNREKREIFSSPKGLFKNGELIILIDEFSASASEILAGAIQDNDRGVIIGRRSFGKGLIQEQIGLKDNSAMRLTVARYYTPVGRSIQRQYENGIDNYFNEFYSRVIDEFSLGNDTNKYDTIQFITKSGKIVYGGGGIMPDIHIAYDDIYKNDSLRIYFSNLFQFAFEYVDINRQELTQKYSDAENFIKFFNVNKTIWNRYINFIFENNKTLNKNTICDLSNEEKEFLEIQLKANIGRNLYDFECYYPIIKQVDNILNEAIEYLNK